MNRRYIAIVTDFSMANQVHDVTRRLLSVPATVVRPGSLRRTSARIAEMQPDAVLYSWSGDTLGVIRWLEQRLQEGGELEVVVFAYKGFAMEDAFTINRFLAWLEQVQTTAFAA